MRTSYFGLLLPLVIVTAAAGQAVPGRGGYSVDEGNLPLVISDHALLKEVPDDFPVLMVGQMPVGGNPRFVPNSEPAWNLLEREDTGALAKLVESKLPMRSVPPRGPAVMLASPTNEQWMPASLVRHGTKLVLHVNVWDRPPGGPPKEASRRAYLTDALRLPDGQYELTLMCDHLKPIDSGFYVSTGESQVGTTKLAVVDGSVDGSTRLLAGDLKPIHADVEQGPASTPPLHWARQIHAPITDSPEPYSMQITQMDARKYLAQMPVRSNSVPPFTPLRQGVIAPGNMLHAVIMGPTLNSGEFVMLQAITREAAGGYTIHMQTWRDGGGRRGNSPSQMLFVVPLAFLLKGRQWLTVTWQEYHAPTLLNSYGLKEKEPAPPTTVSINVG